MASSRISGARLDGLWQQVAEPAFWLSPDLKLIWVNRAWEALTGHSAEEVIGLSCRAHGPTRAGDLAGLAGSFFPPPEARLGQPAGGPTLIVHASGERRWRRIEFWPFHDTEGSLLGLFGLVAAADAPQHAPDAESQHLRNELLTVRDRLHERHGFDSLIGEGPTHRRLLEQVAAASTTMVPVLIVGEPGTGKHLVARTIHQQGPRRQSPIFPFDCAALPPDELERELFGAETSTTLALPENATVMIGDILDMPRDLQGRLAAALDGRVRVAAITASDPECAHRSERLRSDLYYALTALVIRLNPLRERQSEIPVLAQHLLERVNARGERQRSGFTSEALGLLLGYDWPGNLRELARVVEDAHASGPDDLIAADDFPASIRGHFGAAFTPPPPPPTNMPLDELLTQVERRLIETALQRARQNKSRAAEFLGISRPRLYRRIKELGLPDEPEPTDESPSVNGARALSEARVAHKE